MIYLDHAATTQMNDTALEVYVNIAKHYWGNPSSLHDYGAEAKQLLDAARRTISKIIECEAEEIIFTSGGSEANQLAIKSLVSSLGPEKNHLIVSEIEHSSVSNLFESLKKKGFEISTIGVSNNGRVDLDHLEKMITEKTGLISIQHANSEIGVIQDVEKISELCKKRNVLFHSDCVQTFCKIGIEAKLFDSLSVSSHKVYGPKGVGAFYLKKGIQVEPEIPGTSQEKGLKAGTQNVPGIAAFATASKLLYAERSDEYIRMTMLRAQIMDGFRKNGINLIEEGDPKKKLPNILGLRFPGMEGQFMMLECSQAGLGISTGSACQVGSDKPNKTMKALGRSDDEAREFVRISLGKNNNEDQIDMIIEKIHVILERHFTKVKF
ncbi:MAG: IscS subfamily cysteine desulfurase [Balneola sp.]